VQGYVRYIVRAVLSKVVVGGRLRGALGAGLEARSIREAMELSSLSKTWKTKLSMIAK
jgi:hypothetical protein